MKQFTEFVHFINSEKQFTFLKVTDTEFDKSRTNEYTGETMEGIPYLKKKLLKYNGFTIQKFKEYIKSNQDVIKNEIQDIFHRQNKEQLTDIHNKSLFLEKYIQDYKTLNSVENQPTFHQNIVFSYPINSIKNYNQLPPSEKNEISKFLKLEFDLTFEIINWIKNLEKEISYKKLIKTEKEIFGFELNTDKKVDLRSIYLLLDGSLINCEVEKFKKAFNGEKQKTPLRIKWLLQHRNKSNKRALMYFLTREVFKNVDDDDEFLQKIRFCFADTEGNIFDKKSLKENMRQYNDEIAKIESEDNKKDWKVLIDEKVAVIQQYLQS